MAPAVNNKTVIWSGQIGAGEKLHFMRLRPVKR
jgi:hypothetical protein